MQSPVSSAAPRPTSARGRRGRARILPVVLGGLVLLGVASGLTWRELFAAPAPIEPFHAETLEDELLAFLRSKVAAAAANARSAEAHGDLGLAYQANRLWGEAAASYDIAIQLDPTNVEWRLHKAICVFTHGGMEASLAMFEELESELPESPALLLRLGEGLLQANRLDEALERFERLIELYPQLPEGYAGRGMVQNQRREYEAAIGDLEHAVKLDRQFRTAYYQLGLAYKGIGETKRARWALMRGQDAKPRYLPTDLDPVLRSYAVRYNKEVEKAERFFQEGDTKRSVGILEAFRRRRPNDVDVLVRLASMYRRLDNTKKAHEILKRALDVDPDRMEASLELVENFLASRAPKKALAETERAIGLAPEDPEPVLMKARVLLFMKRVKDADLVMQELADSDHGDSEIRFRLCQLNLDFGRTYIASRWLKEAETLDPTDDRIPALSEALNKTENQ